MCTLCLSLESKVIFNLPKKCLLYRLLMGNSEPLKYSLLELFTFGEEKKLNKNTSVFMAFNQQS